MARVELKRMKCEGEVRICKDFGFPQDGAGHEKETHRARETVHGRHKENAGTTFGARIKKW